MNPIEKTNLNRGKKVILESLLHRIVPTGLMCLAAAWALQLSAQSSEPESTGTAWKYGIQASAGYFNFRDSLFVEIDPDPPGNLGDDWLELVIKPWVSFERETGNGTWFGAASWAYARTSENASEISGGDASSASFDNLYLGWRHGSPGSGQFEVAGGR